MYSRKILDLLKNKDLNVNEWFKQNYHTLKEKDTWEDIILMYKDYIVKYQEKINKLKNMDDEIKSKFAINDKNNKIETWNRRIDSTSNDEIPKLISTKQILEEKLKNTNDAYIKGIINIAIDEVEEHLKDCNITIKNYKQSLIDIELFTDDDIINNMIKIYEESIARDNEELERELESVERSKKYNEEHNVYKINEEINELFK